MSDEVKPVDTPPAVEGQAEVTAALGLINKYPKLALIAVVLLMGGAPNLGKLVFPNKCDPEITKHIEDIKTSQAETGEAVQDIKTEQADAKKNISAISAKQETIRGTVSDIKSEQKIMKASVNNIKEDVKENKDDIKSVLKK